MALSQRFKSKNASTAGLSLILLLLVTMTIVVLLGFHSNFFQSNVQSKGASDSAPWLMIAFMYFSMILGVVAQSFYFDGGVSPSASWIKPILASPIIFIPLLSSYQSSLASMTGVTISDLMILLVSFQNGFFWKVIFDKQAELLAKQRN